jgi:hypothetical protein
MRRALGRALSHAEWAQSCFDALDGNAAGKP